MAIDYSQLIRELAIVPGSAWCIRIRRDEALRSPTDTGRSCSVCQLVRDPKKWPPHGFELEAHLLPFTGEHFALTRMIYRPRQRCLEHP